MEFQISIMFPVLANGTHYRPGWTWEKGATITIGIAGQESSLLLPDQQTALPSTAVPLASDVSLSLLVSLNQGWKGKFNHYLNQNKLELVLILWVWRVDNINTKPICVAQKLSWSTSFLARESFLPTAVFVICCQSEPSLASPAYSHAVVRPRASKLGWQRLTVWSWNDKLQAAS